MNSTHKVEVFRVDCVLPHANADLLEIVPVWDYQCCVAKGSFQVGDLAAYVPPDSVVPTSRPEFAFLATKAGQTTARIKAKKLRGVWSMGLLLPAPEGFQEGDDAAEFLQVTHYEPPMQTSKQRSGCSFTSGAAAATPPGNWNIHYDLEAWRRYGKQVFQAGEMVAVTEKIHGANARYVWAGGRLHCGSRKTWKQEYAVLPTLAELVQNLSGDEKRAKEIYQQIVSKPQKKDLWWQAIEQYPDVIVWLQRHSGYTLYGEVFGRVQDLTYGTQPGELRLAFFDILSPAGVWLDYEALKEFAVSLPLVPEVYVGPYDAEKISHLASGTSLIPGAEQQIREGVVVRSLSERTLPTYGRAVLKLVSNEYLAR